MIQKGKFMLFDTPEEFKDWLSKQKITRQIKLIQNHHTWSPSYRHFKGNNYFELLESMEKAHLGRNFSQIAQHLTTFSDGKIAVCRDFNIAPAGIKGANTYGICIENIGNFDIGGDVMDEVHKKSIISLNAILCDYFKLEVNKDTVVYHVWYNGTTGKRDNDSADKKVGNYKTCPGTNFFGGNSVANAEKNFYPLIIQEIENMNKPIEQPKTYPTLRKGSKGEYVKVLQQKLKDLGYAISVDGDFGTKTETVVKLFQNDNNLVSDGVCGAKSWGALEIAKSIEKENPKPTEPIKEKENTTDKYKHKYYKIASTHIVEVDPLALKISVQDKSANTINLSNFVTSGFQVEQAEKTNLPMYPNSDATIQMGKYKCYPLGILVSEGKVIQNRQPHNKSAGTLIVYRDGKVECKPVLNILQETDFKNVWFAVSGVSILPDILMKQEGFTGLFSDVGRITSRPVIGYNPEKNKIIIAVRPLSNINRGKETLMNLGCTMGISLDAGGSTILRVDGRTYMNTTRRLFSVITW